jgi:SNF2 family DNA or RNA helicase
MVFRTPIEKNQNDERRQHLARIVSPFLLRRKKSEVITELPDKSEIIQTVELDEGQRDLYEAIRLTMQKKLRDSIKTLGLARSHIMILDALLKLRQICCDPRLLKDDQKAHKMPSAKLNALMAMLPELIEEGRQVLLFSQFTSMLSLIEEELKAINLPYVILTGSTKDRKTPVQQFQSGKVPLFLISLKAGGTGLNLTAADTVIHYDPWWNPAVENQATDRAHRMGQKKKVFVYRLVTKDTVEEKMVELQKRKFALTESLLDQSKGAGAAFTLDDLQILFGSVG